MVQHVSQHDQFHEQLLAIGLSGVRNHLVDRRRTEALAGIPVFLCAGRAAQVGVRHHEVRGLIGFVLRTTELNQVFLAEGEHTIERELFFLPLRLGPDVIS